MVCCSLLYGSFSSFICLQSIFGFTSSGKRQYKKWCLLFCLMVPINLRGWRVGGSIPPLWPVTPQNQSLLKSLFWIFSCKTVGLRWGLFRRSAHFLTEIARNRNACSDSRPSPLLRAPMQAEGGFWLWFSHCLYARPFRPLPAYRPRGGFSGGSGVKCHASSPARFSGNA